MAFESVRELVARFVELGATNIFCKRLAENDNSKQQIYLGGSFEVLSLFPYGEVVCCPGLKEPNFKAPLDLHWIGRATVERAASAQLILYPKYPEVRLSGFLSGCTTAPSQYLQPLRRDQRTGGTRGILVFGTTPDRRVLCCFAAPRSPLGNELDDFVSLSDDGVFCRLPLSDGRSTRSLLLEKLREINGFGAVCSARMTSEGECVSYIASNAGGTTLEALLGIRPNSESKPDYLGWEIKAFSEKRITLMTPEPNGGKYFAIGVGAFTREYGHGRSDGSFYFTGLHRYGERCARTGLTLDVAGFDRVAGKITDVDGKVFLRGDSGEDVASWSFGGLLTHWSRKHASAAYVPVRKSLGMTTMYSYGLPAILGEGTDFGLYLAAVCSGAVVFDPGSKVEAPAMSGKAGVKARSQFRIGVADLDKMYLKVTKES